MIQSLINVFYYCVRDLKHLVDLKPIIHKLLESSTCDDRLDITDTVQQIVLPAAVKLRQHIVEQQQRNVLRHFFHKLDL